MVFEKHSGSGRSITKVNRVSVHVEPATPEDEALSDLECLLEPFLT